MVRSNVRVDMIIHMWR